MSDEQSFEGLRTRVEAWVEGPGERWAERIEETGEVPEALWAELNGLGFLRMAAPVAYGGHGLPFSRWMELMEVFSRSHGSIRMIVHVVNGIWRAMDGHATEEQRKRFVIPSITGEIKIAFTLTEPGNGTGADITTSVVREGDTYYLSGSKHLITFGVRCDYYLLAARVEGSAGHEGTVALLVPRNAPGVTVEDTSNTMGVTGTDHASLTFDRTPVPVDHRLGAEGEGLDVFLGGFLTPSRVSVAMSCVGLAERAQQLAVAYARDRVTFGKALTQRQAIQFMLAENAADIEAAKQLVLHAARRFEEGAEDASMQSSMAKMHAVTMLTNVTDKALQIHGGLGYWKSQKIERVYRDARAQRFEEGTNEVQKAVVFREVLRRTPPVAAPEAGR
ncbi:MULTISPECIES: acyl-CoA dehydrogenase family protein [Streptomyces]|uniref:Acyl-CoA dehydrogenase family protein n=1 Tax=Streptomyces evansiae TaxID=3075535 RepID=A0ABD5E3K4_9ACTN|nr:MULTISPECIES: acyl-CoA dehydrogenase family protein [unclassified Streptomyces]ASY35736.1 acyl-CoA dehydrogenase [Streptomyces sp. CLI2509]EFK98863.1 acyl-CoA dehydrogenase domain-containing protein [Streptomyces sp. SPB78]MDT0408037.1 acyl-CoA dehydrogenase family protein [Streptomyces sp. DSM 41979]MDT0415968.1 acyl-CoA dehydrogenase family protein [Streptomyces sp. DSM 41982]MYQ59399.1 acyl-CoA dehydrogenase [Streptomyces sp. SID4926]